MIFLPGSVMFNVIWESNIMKMTDETKTLLKQEIIASLSPEKEVHKIVIFGSFLTAANPNDIDVAIFQDSAESYLSLAQKYRKLTRNITRKIPLDIVPIKANAPQTTFLEEIEAGELIYER